MHTHLLVLMFPSSCVPCLSPTVIRSYTPVSKPEEEGYFELLMKRYGQYTIVCCSAQFTSLPVVLCMECLSFVSDVMLNAGVACDLN